jgi:hypothetical protein
MYLKLSDAFAVVIVGKKVDLIFIKNIKLS